MIKIKNKNQSNQKGKKMKIKRLLAITGEQEKRTQPKPSKPPRKYVFQASEFKPWVEKL